VREAAVTATPGAALEPWPDAVANAEATVRNKIAMTAILAMGLIFMLGFRENAILNNIGASQFRVKADGEWP
jgi:hypothetical protein